MQGLLATGMKLPEVAECCRVVAAVALLSDPELGLALKPVYMCQDGNGAEKKWNMDWRAIMISIRTNEMAKIRSQRTVVCLVIYCLFVCLSGWLLGLVGFGLFLFWRWRVPSNCCQAVTPGGPITNLVPQKRQAEPSPWDSGGIIEELLVENNDVWSLKITFDVWASHVLSIASESR